MQQVRAQTLVETSGAFPPANNAAMGSDMGADGGGVGGEMVQRSLFIKVVWIQGGN